MANLNLVEIQFSTDRRGRPIAHRLSRNLGYDRLFRISYRVAKDLVTTGQARGFTVDPSDGTRTEVSR